MISLFIHRTICGESDNVAAQNSENVQRIRQIIRA